MKLNINLLMIFLFVFSLLGRADALASTHLKKLDIKNGEEVNLVFDEKIDSSRISTEYLNDIIQLSLSNASVYPAKINTIPKGPISKVFIYQYSPKVVRCRLTLRGNAEDYRSRFKISPSGHLLSLRVQNLSPKTVQTDAIKPLSIQKSDLQMKETLEVPKLNPLLATNVLSDSIKLQTPEKSKPKDSVAPEDDRSLQDKIIHATQLPLNSEEVITAPEKSAVKEKSIVLGGAKTLPSVGNVIGKLGIVVLLMGFFVFLLKKFTMAQKGNTAGILKAVQKYTGVKFGEKDKMIEVLSTQFLGPKKSISVVRVAGRTLVLGVSQESIHLITQISDKEDNFEMDDLPEDLSKDKLFSDLLHEDKGVGGSVMASGVRSRIRSRLEGLKPL